MFYEVGFQLFNLYTQNILTTAEIPSRRRIVICQLLAIQDGKN